MNKFTRYITMPGLFRSIGRTTTGAKQAFAHFIALILLLSGAGAPLGLIAADTGTQPTGDSAPIPWNEVGAAAGKQYQGDGLAVTATKDGAQLRSVFQKFEGQATPDGLWIVSTAPGTEGERFRVMAQAVGREGGAVAPLAEAGTVRMQDKLVTFERPGLAEEYSTSIDGIRQDFLIAKRPVGAGGLCVELTVAGAKAVATASGAKLVLQHSGREIAYSRLRVVDATGRELAARIEVPAPTKMTVHVDDTDAAYPVRIDPTFSDANWINIGSYPAGANGSVNAIAADGNGNIYFAGDFSTMGNIKANRIAKWNGSAWSALGSGVSGSVYALAVSGTDLYAGGSFTTAGGVSANRIAKWNGSAWSALGSGVGGNVLALAASGGNVYAGGVFTAAGGASANRIAKWDGNAWSALGAGMNSDVNALAASGPDLYVGGNFSTAGGASATRVAKWDGSAWSALGLGVNGNVYALAVSGANLYVGGQFTTAGGSSANNIARWNGSAWFPLGLGTYGNRVTALAVSGANLYVGGSFFIAYGVPNTNFFARWNGSAWSSVGIGDGNGVVNAAVSAIAVSGTDLYVGGQGISIAGGVAADQIAKWNGTAWSAVSPGGTNYVNRNVYSFAVSGTDLYVGGNFTVAGGVAANFIAKWNGSTWSALGSGLTGVPLALAVSGTDLYAGGGFTTAGGVAVSNIAKWNGSVWSALGSGVSGSVYALAVSGTDLYVGGGFTTAGGVSANRVARWSGSTWSALGSGVDNYVVALAVLGGDLYAGGYFTTAGGAAANYIAKWNGSAWSPLGLGVNYTVQALAVSGADLYAGGFFTSAGGSPARNVARWNGSVWSPLGSGVNDGVSALAVSGTDLYVAGSFNSAGGVSASRLAKWNGSTWSALGSGVDNYVYALAVSGTDLYVGGQFATAGPLVSSNLAKATLLATTSPAVVTLGSLNQTYTGSGLSATATTTPPGLAVDFTYNGSATLPVNVGSYTVVGTINDGSYEGSATSTLVIGKATATVTLASLNQAYTGSGLSATATTSPVGLTVNFTYNGSATLPVAAGSYTVVGTINNANYEGSATGTLVIGKATATVTLANLSQTYTGSGLSASATTSPAGLTVNFTYDGVATLPVNAGSYTVVGTIDDANYAGSATGTLVIGKAAATVTLANLTQTYTGSGLSASATTAPTGLTVNFTYDGAATPPVNAGSYAVVGTIDDPQYQGTAAGTLVIGKANATITLTNLSQPYTGSGLVATATTTPPGLAVDLTYNGLPALPVNAGSYAVVATINDPNYVGSTGTWPAAGAGIVNEDFNSGALPATTEVAGTSVAFTDGGVLFTGNSANNATRTYLRTIAADYFWRSFVAEVTVNVKNVVYFGMGTGIRNPGFFNEPGLPSITMRLHESTTVGGRVDAVDNFASLTAPTNSFGSPGSGTHRLRLIWDATAKTATFQIDRNYTGGAFVPDLTSIAINGADNGFTDSNTKIFFGGHGLMSFDDLVISPANTLVIRKAAAPVTLANLSHTYTGSGVAATATTIPAGLAVNLTYNGSIALPVDAGSYSVVGKINDPNYAGSATGTLVIGKAAATVTLANLSQIYTGSGLSATATTAPAGLTVNFTYDGLATLPINAGSYTVVGTINNANYAGSATGTLVIGKAAATVTLANLSQIYTGSGLSATATTAPGGLTVNFTYDGLATLPVNAGSYAVVGTINDANYAGSATGTLVISKAAATVTLANLSQIYTGSGLSATATTSPGGLAVNLTYDGAATLPINAGSYAVVGTINDANYAGSTTGTLVIGKAAATVTLADLSQIYTGSGLSAAATTAPGGLTVNFTYDGLATLPINAGSYTVVGTISDANYAGSATGTLVISKAAAIVTLANLSQTYTGNGLSATATTSPGGLAVNLTYDGAATLPVNAGSYAVVGTINDGNYAGSATGTLVIGKAAATVTLADLSQTYTGSGLSATATTSPGGLAVNLTYDGAATLPINAGGYAVLGAINDANYAGSATGTLVIGKAAATVNLANLSQAYTGSGLGATTTTTPAGLAVTVTYDGSATLPVDAGSYIVAATIDDTNYAGSATGTLTIFHPNLAVIITGPASGFLQTVDSTVNLTGSFTPTTAPGAYTASWVLSATMDTETVIPGIVNGNLVSAQVEFTTPGVYSIRLVVTDGVGTIGQANLVQNDLPAYVVIYDPEGGHVTGGGWINSPAGAFRPDFVEFSGVVGKATFGFVSKYKNGAQVPTGNTEFQFKAGNVHFKSTVYEWLTVAGARAQYKGSGTINGGGDYGFKLTAIDGDLLGNGKPDRFRIKIWENSSGAVIYDNQNSADNADLTTPGTLLGGGSIVIHKTK